MLLFHAFAALLALQSPPPCRENLDSLQHRLELDYAGFRLEVKGNRAARYRRMLDTLRVRAGSTPPADCLGVLKTFTAWFADPHLFVFQRTGLDTAETRRRAAAIEHREIDETRLRAWLTENAKGLDPVEGIWYEGPLRLAVLPDSARGPGRFLALVLTSDTSTWRPGDVRARFAKRSNGTYAATVHSRNLATRELDAGIHKRVLLRFSPGIWGKEFPIAPADSGLLDPVDAHRATILVRDRTVIVSVPSHDPAYRRALDSVMTANRRTLDSASRLIVDLRGNEGGSSGMTKGLRPYIVTARRRRTKWDGGESVMLSSPDQVAYLQRGSFGDPASPFVRSLVARLERSPNELVPLEDPGAPADPIPADSVVFGPERVGVLVDGGTVSAAEVLVLDALRSERATVFGEPTGGALDYQSVQIVPFHSRETRWLLGYPTIARSTALPRDGMRGKGIPPMVRLDLGRIVDPIGEVERRLK